MVKCTFLSQGVVLHNDVSLGDGVPAEERLAGKFDHLDAHLLSAEAQLMLLSPQDTPSQVILRFKSSERLENLALFQS